MAFSSLDGGEDCKYNGAGMVQMSEIFVTQDDVFLWDDPLSKLYSQGEHVDFTLDQTSNTEWW